MTLYEDLKWRGLIQDISSPELIDKLNAGGMTFYIGTDPTADSQALLRQLQSIEAVAAAVPTTL